MSLSPASRLRLFSPAARETVWVMPVVGSASESMASSPPTLAVVKAIAGRSSELDLIVAGCQPELKAYNPLESVVVVSMTDPAASRPTVTPARPASPAS